MEILYRPIYTTRFNVGEDVDVVHLVSNAE